jgi:outer membrane protein assembly factor BamB
MARRVVGCGAVWVAGFVSLVLAMPVAAQGQWPGWLGPQRDGHSPDTGLAKSWPADGPKLLWKTSTVGDGWSSVAVVNDRVYTTGNSGDNQMLFCFDVQGKELWKVAQGPKCSHKNYPGARSTPTFDADRLYVTGGNGLVTCHAAADGRIIWRRDMKEMGGKSGGWMYGESVLVLGDLAIVTPGGSHAIVALDKTTGKDVWKSDVSATAGYSSCIAAKQGEDTMIVNGSQDGLLAVDAKTGKKIWTNGFATRNTANVPTPAYEDGYLMWAVGYQKGGICFKVDYSGGQWSFKQAWATTDLNCHPGNYVVAQGRVYGKGKGLTCVDLKTGKTAWTEPSVAAGEVSWADGMLYVFSDTGGKVFLVEPLDKGCKVAGSFRVEGKGKSWAYPTVAGGRLYLRYDTNLYCYDVKAK